MVNRQKAVTPKFLKRMLGMSSSRVINDPDDHAADLIGGGFFFAMRSCKFSKPKQAGRTKPIRLGGVRFFNHRN